MGLVLQNNQIRMLYHGFNLALSLAFVSCSPSLSLHKFILLFAVCLLVRTWS